MNDRALSLRAQEIISASADGMTTAQAMEAVLRERFAGDPDGLLKWAASVGSSGLKGIRKRTYEIPDLFQGTLIQIPQVIGVTTPEGDLLIPRDKATLGQVRQWAREASQHHSVQKLRFKRFREQLDTTLKEESDELPWWSARALMLGPAAESDADDAE